VSGTSEAGRKAHAAFKATPFFSSLNGVRALCALIVVKEHAGWRLPLPQLFEWGFLGVDMFFVISGFLIVTLLLRERDATHAIDLRSFYVRRTLRIFPIYYLVIFLIFVTALVSYPHSTKTWDQYKWSFPVFLLYAQDLIPVSLGLMFHTWSLSMEEQFYLVWPAVEKFVRAAWIVPLIVVLLLVNQAVNFHFFGTAIAALYGTADAVDRPIFLITFTPILLGVLAAHAMHDARLGPRVAGVLQGRWVPALLLLVAVAVCQVAPGLQGVARLCVHLLFCALLVSLVINPANVFAGFLNWRPLAYLGTISYGLYLYHTFVIFTIDKLVLWSGRALAPWAVFAIATAVSIALASLSFRYFERPVMALRHRRAKVVTPASTLHLAKADRPPG
jgi:peptidoglycan/LPS O-acetylase OafA/YrhL